MYKQLIRPILFRFNPEAAHKLIFAGLKIMQAIPGAFAISRSFQVVKSDKLKRTLFGIDFPNPVGLAAGLDKDAEVFDMMGALGFGFIEIGTVTPKAQPGNPKPRLFRLTKNDAIINRMGFNNLGVDNMVSKLKKRRTKVVIAGNIGKNKITPNSEAINDYLISFNSLHAHVDFFVVNVSSPNTPNLRELQDKEPLKNLLLALVEENQKKSIQRPILLKMAPDLNDSQLKDIVDLVSETGIQGLVANNTTISRDGLDYSKDYIESLGAGGLSGAPLKNRSLEVLKFLRSQIGPEVPIISVGGIMSPQDAIDRLEAGADLVQIYTGFIYEGPGLVKKINQAIAQN